jgi:cytoskeleton protein RodZ
MSELGRLLTEARTAKDLSLVDVENAIRVRQKYLEALEQGNYAALPPGATARGFLGNYARFLGLDSAEALRVYASESGDHGPVVPMAGSNGARTVDYRPLEVTLMHENPSNWWRWVLAILLVAALAAGGWWLLNNRNRVSVSGSPGWLAAFGPRPTNTRTATPTQALMTVTPPAAPANLPSPVAPVVMAGASTGADTSTSPTPTSDLLTLPIPTVPPTPTRTATPRPTATPEPSIGISLTMKTTQRAWTKVTADGKVLLQELLEAGQQRGFAANQEVIVLTGNAGGLDLTINNQELGALGNVGQVVERTWQVNPDGQIAEVTPGKGTATVTALPATPEITANPTR